MGNKSEFESELDEIPASYPYKFVQGLRNVYRHIKEGEKIDEGIPFSLNASSTDGDIQQLVDGLNRTNHKREALQILDEIVGEVDHFRTGSGKVLQLAQKLYKEINPAP